MKTTRQRSARAAITASLAILLAGALGVASVEAKGKPGGGGPPPNSDPAIAFKQSKGSQFPNRIVVTNNDGSDRYEPGLEGLHPTMSPDGSQLVYWFDGDLWLANVDGTGVTYLTTLLQWGGPKPEWSPVPTLDGRSKIAYHDNASANDSTDALWVINTDGSGKQLLLALPDGPEGQPSYAMEPTWSHDASRIVYYRGGAWNPGIVVAELGLDQGALTVTSQWDLDFTGTPLEGSGEKRNPSLGRTADLLALEVNWGSFNGDIWVMDLYDLSTAVNLTDDPDSDYQQPSWCEDDQFLVLGGPRGGKSGGRDAWRIDPDGTNLRTVSGSREPQGGPTCRATSGLPGDA